MQKLSLSESSDEAQLATACKRHYPKQGIGIDYLVKLLELVRCEQQSKDVIIKSPYRFKNTLFAVLRWCVAKDLIQRREDFGKYVFKSQKLTRPNVFYSITEKGEKLLEVLR